MLNCKQTSELMSREMDGKLPFGKRLAIKLHLLMCDGCTNFSSQIFLLRKAARSFGKGQHCKDLRLSDESRQRIYHALQDAQARSDNQA